MQLAKIESRRNKIQKDLFLGRRSESVMKIKKKKSSNKQLEPDGFIGESFQTFKEE